MNKKLYNISRLSTLVGIGLFVSSGGYVLKHLSFLAPDYVRRVDDLERAIEYVQEHNLSQDISLLIAERDSLVSLPEYQAYMDEARKDVETAVRYFFGGFALCLGGAVGAAASIKTKKI